MKAAILFQVLMVSTPVVEDLPGLAKEVASIRRVFVDKLNGGAQAQHIRDMIIASLNNSKLFILTENADKADAYLRGSAEDLIFTEAHQTSDSINAHTGLGSYSNSKSGSGGRGLGSVSIGENESQRTTERKHEATATVRLVKKDGDVIWSTTQESQGAKLKGASADVAEKITRKLIADVTGASKSK